MKPKKKRLAANLRQRRPFSWADQAASALITEEAPSPRVFPNEDEVGTANGPTQDPPDLNEMAAAAIILGEQPKDSAEQPIQSFHILTAEDALMLREKFWPLES